jgi:predicted dehydrogenase
MAMTRKVKLAVLGAGLIGKRHIDHVRAEPEAELMAIVDPSAAGKVMAKEMGVRWAPSFAALIETDKPDGIIIATPNQIHVANGLESIAAGVPALVEKPIADEVASATELVEAAETAGVPLLVGHHRRYNPLIRKAKETIDSGRLGQVLAVHGTCWFYKPDEYFDTPWRREKGAGPVFLNLIHDVDNLRYLCGDVVSVQAIESNAVRRNAVEETAAILLHFKNGVLGTVSVSDAIVAPWSWELTTGENPAYPRTEESCYLIGGTHGSLTIPSLDLWHNREKRSWWEPISRDRIPVDQEDPLTLQIRHFCKVIRQEETPLVPGREGLNTLKVIAAAKQAAETGLLIHIT